MNRTARGARGIKKQAGEERKRDGGLMSDVSACQDYKSGKARCSPFLLFTFPLISKTSRETHIDTQPLIHTLLCSEVLPSNTIFRSIQLTEKHRFSSIVGYCASTLKNVFVLCVRIVPCVRCPLFTYKLQLWVNFGISSLCLNRFLCSKFQPPLSEPGLLKGLCMRYFTK